MFSFMVFSALGILAFIAFLAALYDCFFVVLAVFERSSEIAVI
jgi:hypothetical protein